MKRWIAILLAVCLVWGLAGCHKESAEDTTPTQPSTEPSTEPVQPRDRVELCLPEKTEQWQTCAQALQTRLKAQGYDVRAHYAASAQEQAKQLQELIREDADLLVVASVDAHTLSQELDSAATAGVRVVTLDRQVLHAGGVSAAVTFDYVSLGVSMGYQIAEAKQLATAREEKRSHTIEFLMGSADDQNAVLIHRGVMAVLQPYLDSGVLVSKTGRVTLEDTYVQGWDTQNARDKFDQYLTVYQGTFPEIVCGASDALAAGSIAALTEAGCPGESWPVITGIGGDKAAVRNILEGKQSHTVYRDTESLYDRCSQIIACLLTGQALPQQDNGVVSGVTDAPTYVSAGIRVDGIKGIKALLDYGVSAKSLALTKGDLAKINAEEEAPPETTAPTEPTEPETSAPTEPTEATEQETTAPTETAKEK